MDDGSGDGAWEAALRQADDLVAGPAADSFAARLDGWLADARVDGSADARTRERWLHAAAEADATFGGILLDLAERGTAVTVSTSGGRRHHGGIEVIGADFVAVRLSTGAEVLLALSAVAVVRTAPLVDAALGERVLTTDFRLADVLVELGAERARVLVVTTDGAESVAGQLRAVGRDVVTIRSDGEPPATAYVPLGAIAEVAL